MTLHNEQNWETKHGSVAQTSPMVKPFSSSETSLQMSQIISLAPSLHGRPKGHSSPIGERQNQHGKIGKYLIYVRDNHY